MLFMPLSHSPKITLLNHVTLKELRKLRDEDQIQIQHPLLLGMILHIRKDYKVEQVLNQNVTFYSNNFVLFESFDKVHPKHDVLFKADELVGYLKSLLACNSVSEFHYIRRLQEKGLQVSDIIEFEDGKRGMVHMPEGLGYARNIQYIPLKKDGEISKQRPRFMYSGDKYQVVGNKDQI
jgi:hypothetical protein